MHKYGCKFTFDLSSRSKIIARNMILDCIEEHKKCKSLLLWFYLNSYSKTGPNYKNIGTLFLKYQMTFNGRKQISWCGNWPFKVISDFLYNFHQSRSLFLASCRAHVQQHLKQECLKGGGFSSISNHYAGQKYSRHKTLPYCTMAEVTPI